MRTLPDILTDMRRPYDEQQAPAELLVETCRVLASAADPQRAGSDHVSALVEEILLAYQRRIEALMRATARWLEAVGEHGDEVA